MNTILLKPKNSKTSDPHRVIDYYLQKKLSAPAWNEEFELTDQSYSISDIPDYFEYILKKHGVKTVNPSIRIYVNKIENRITLKTKAGYYLETFNS